MRAYPAGLLPQRVESRNHRPVQKPIHPTSASRTVAQDRSVVDGGPVLLVTHYGDDHSWSFFDGKAYDESAALIVAMQTVLDLHPTLTEIADLPPGWTATRAADDKPWTRQVDEPMLGGG